MKNRSPAPKKPTVSVNGSKPIKKVQVVHFLILVIFVYSIIAMIVAYDGRAQRGNIFTLSSLYERASGLQHITNAVQRDSYCISLSAYCRNIAEQLPPEASVYMSGLVGDQNGSKLGYYYFMVNYLFPRKVSLSLSDPVTFDGNGYIGRSPTNETELVRAGYNLEINVGDENKISFRQLTPIQQVQPLTYNICTSNDKWVAVLLPLLVTGFGIWFIKLLFKEEARLMGKGELFACGMALGLVSVMQFLFAGRLLGMRLEKLVFWFLLVGMVLLAVRYFNNQKGKIITGLQSQLSSYQLLLLPILGLLGALFWLAGVTGLSEYDAVAGWMLKAKIFFLFSGRDLIQWCSDPSLSHAHLDYPVLVPMMHTFTYGVLGHVDEFVTKFWPVWMLTALAVGLLSVFQFPRQNRLLAPLIILVVFSMPVTMQYALAEGATVPSMFFTSLGCIECALGIRQSNKSKFWLGLLLLVAGALTKFEGIIVLFFWGLAAVCYTKTRQWLRLGKRDFVLLVLAVGLTLPYGIFRAQLPQLHPDQLAFKSMAKKPLTVASQTPTVFAILMARQSADENLATWSVNDGQLRWTGRWDGISSLISSYNLGWGWLCMILGAGCIAWRVTRPTAIIFNIVILCFIGAIAAVYCALPYFGNNLNEIIPITGNGTGGRQLYPIFIAWGLTLTALVASNFKTAPQIESVKSATKK